MQRSVALVDSDAVYIDTSRVAKKSRQAICLESNGFLMVVFHKVMEDAALGVSAKDSCDVVEQTFAVSEAPAAKAKSRSQLCCRTCVVPVNRVMVVVVVSVTTAVGSVVWFR